MLFQLSYVFGHVAEIVLQARARKMVHFHFIRKQFAVYFKIILVAIFVVYFLSYIVNLIPSSGSRLKRNAQKRRKLSGPPAVTLKAAENGLETKDYHASLIGQWTALAKNVFANIGHDINTKLQGKLNVHRWYSICGTTVDNLRRHILFPKHPKIRTTISLLRMRTTLKDFGQRIFGYIHPPLSGAYQFAVSSDDFSEVWLGYDATSNNTNLICQVGGLYKGVYIVGSTRPGEFDKYVSQTSQYIYLEGDQKYYFEILHKQGEGQGHLHVAWKMPGWKYFTIITSEFLSLFTLEEQARVLANSDDHVFADELVLKHHKHVRIGHHHSGGYRNFTRLTRAEKIPLLRRPREKLPVCQKEERKFVVTLKRYQGIRYAQIPNVYPSDGSKLVIQVCQNAKSADECKGNPMLEEKKAYLIARKFFNATFSRNYSLISVIRVEMVLEKHTPAHDHRYFIELEVYDTVGNETWRIAEHFVEKSTSGELCYLTKLPWKPDVTVYFIITVKNQGVWIRHFIDNIVDIQEATSDTNIHPIIVDFGSRDLNTETYLKRSRLKEYSVIHKTGHFYKTAAINEAADLVKNDNSIIFLLDLHLDLPVNLIQYVRKHTIQGHMAFVPLLTRLACGSSPDFPTGHWEEQGYGLFAIYKSDWSRFGGMNVKEFSDHWGGEDWEMIDRVVAHNIVVHKLKIPGLFHFYHTRRNMWDKAV